MSTDREPMELAAEIGEDSMRLKRISESDCMMDVDGLAWRQIVEFRGGCCCHISPPCAACTAPITEDELNEVGYTYGGVEELLR